jgi:hypothetical protein
MSAKIPDPGMAARYSAALRLLHGGALDGWSALLYTVWPTQAILDAQAAAAAAELRQAA